MALVTASHGTGMNFQCYTGVLYADSADGTSTLEATDCFDNYCGYYVYDGPAEGLLGNVGHGFCGVKDDLKTIIRAACDGDSIDQGSGSLDCIAHDWCGSDRCNYPPLDGTVDAASALTSSLGLAVIGGLATAAAL